MTGELKAGSATSALRVRDATEADLPAVQELYAHYVLHSLSTFEEEPPSVEELARRRRKVLDLGLPWLIAESDRSILGYAYAGPHRPRAAYRYAVEDSIYIARGCEGRGAGSALLGELVARCSRGPWRQMIAVIGDSGNLASIELHRKFGFRMVGVLTDVGFKFGIWVDTPLMQRELGP